jgi:AcrR family transcriptional regulator
MRNARAYNTGYAAPVTSRGLAKLRTRQRVLEAARRLFTERGYEAATMRDIAADVGMSTGAVFVTFTDKASLFNAVLIADYEALSERLRELDVRGLGAREALINLLGLAYDYNIEQIGLVRAAMSFAWQRDAAGFARDREGLQLILSILAGVLIQGIERGELSPSLDADLTAEMLWEAHLANYRWIIFENWSVAALLTRLRAQIDVLLAGYRAVA